MVERLTDSLAGWRVRNPDRPHPLMYHTFRIEPEVLQQIRTGGEIVVKDQPIQTVYGQDILLVQEGDVIIVRSNAADWRDYNSLRRYPMPGSPNHPVLSADGVVVSIKEIIPDEGNPQRGAFKVSFLREPVYFQDFVEPN